MDFDKAAGMWDSERRVKRAAIIAEEIRKSVRTGMDLSALEFGCGTGLISFNLKDCFECITLVDTSQGMIDTLNSKIKESETANMRALCADVGVRPLTDQFDAIYSSMALHHVNDTQAMLKALTGMLRADGCLCIVDLNEDDGGFHGNEPGFSGHNGFDPQTLAGIFESLGLKNVWYRTFYNDSKAIGGKTVDYSLFIIMGTKAG